MLCCASQKLTTRIPKNVNHAFIAPKVSFPTCV
jgi:hypothetical protein